MNGNPLSTLSIPERRERLFPFYDTSIALDGILTFISKRGSKIIFMQNPSNLCVVSPCNNGNLLFLYFHAHVLLTAPRTFSLYCGTMHW